MLIVVYQDKKSLFGRMFTPSVKLHLNQHLTSTTACQLFVNFYYHRHRSSVNFGEGGKTFSPKNMCMKNLQNA